MPFERAVSKSILKTSLCWCSLGRSHSELMGVRSQNRKIAPGLDEDEKLAELISVATRKTRKPLRWWTFGEPGGQAVRSLSLKGSLLINA